MKKTLIILAHNNYENWVSNKTIIDTIKEKFNSNNISNTLEIRNLIELYPDYKIDVASEQKSLIEADNIIIQFPFYWYSLPAIWKAWLDDVLQYWFAYWSWWDKVKWKNLILSFTVWWNNEMYQKSENNISMDELLKPFEKSSSFIQTNYIKPIYSTEMMYIPWVNNIDDIISKAKKHAEKLFSTLENL